MTSPEQYKFLNQSGSFTVDGVKDSDEFKHTKTAMNVVGISEQQQQEVWKIIAIILHIGNLTFQAKGK